MARKPKRSRKAPAAPPPRGTTDRDKAIDALMALLAEHSFEQIGLAEVAGRAGLKLSALARRIRLDARHPRRPYEGHRPRGAFRRRRRHGGGAAARAAVRRADAAARGAGALQGRGALADALGAAQSGPRARAQRHGGAFAEMDAGGRRHRRARPARRVARARRRADVRPRARRLVRRRRARASTAPWPRSTAGSPAPSAGTVSSAICARCRNASCAARAAAAVATRKKRKRLNALRAIEAEEAGSRFAGRRLEPAPAPSPASRRADCRPA